MPTEQKKYQIADARFLPISAWHIFFMNAIVFYQGRQLVAKDVILRSGLGKLKKLVVGDYTYLEQNPFSGSKYAKMAQEGAKILWIIHTKTGKYVGKVMDGRVEKLK